VHQKNRGVGIRTNGPQVKTMKHEWQQSKKTNQSCWKEVNDKAAGKGKTVLGKREEDRFKMEMRSFRQPLFRKNVKVRTRGVGGRWILNPVQGKSKSPREGGGRHRKKIDQASLNLIGKGGSIEKGQCRKRKARWGGRTQWEKETSSAQKERPGPSPGKILIERKDRLREDSQKEKIEQSRGEGDAIGISFSGGRETNEGKNSGNKSQEKGVGDKKKREKSL